MRSSVLRQLWLLVLVFILPAGIVQPLFAQAPVWQWTSTASGYVSSYSTAVDAAGYVYISGRYMGTATFGATTLTASGNLDSDVFVAKLSSSGVYQWVVRAGGSGTDYSSGVAVDGSGNVYVTGSFGPSATFGATTLTSSGSSDDVFVAKLNSAGVWQWAMRAGSPDDDSSSGLAVDGNGNVVVTGIFATATITCSPTTPAVGGAGKVFVAKLSAAGTWQWIARGGTTNTANYSVPHAIAVDGNGYVDVTGVFSGTATFGAVTLGSSGSTSYKIFVAQLSPGGAWQWAVSEGSSSEVESRALAIDNSGNVYVSGYFSGTATFGSTTLNSNAGSTDIYVAQLTSAGAWQWAVPGGGANSESSRGLAVDIGGNVYVTGLFGGASTTFGSTTLTNMGSNEVFVAKLSPLHIWRWAVSAGGTSDDEAYGLALDGNQNVYVTGFFRSPTASFGNTTLTNNAAGSDGLFISRLAQRPPTITSFTPTSAKTGVAVTLTGTNFTGATSVRFHNVNVTGAGVTVLSDTQVRAAVPTGATSGKVYVVTPTGMAQSSTSLTIVQPPIISSFSPASGSPGSVVLLTGSNYSGTTFPGVTSVKLNGVSVPFVVNSATSLTLMLPAGATTGKLSVTTVAGTATTTSSFTVTTTPVPTISSFSPTTGPRNSTVVVTGTNFSGVTAVKLGTVAVAAGSYTVNSATSLTLTVPATATTGKVFITAAGGMAQSSSDYTVILPPTLTSFAPTSGHTGAVVTLNGTNFQSGGTSVSFGDVASPTVTWVSSAKVTASVPAGAITGAIAVTTVAGTASKSTFTYLGPRPGPRAETDEPLAADELTLYPNPAHNTVWLSGATATTIQLLNARGQLVRSLKLAAHSSPLDLTGLPPGLYLVRCGTTRRLVVE